MISEEEEVRDLTVSLCATFGTTTLKADAEASRDFQKLLMFTLLTLADSMLAEKLNIICCHLLLIRISSKSLGQFQQQHFRLVELVPFSKCRRMSSIDMLLGRFEWNYGTQCLCVSVGNKRKKQ